MKDVYQVKETDTNEKEVLTINYSRPKFWHRLMANFTDIFIMLALFLGIFVGVRAIVQNTAYYKGVFARIDEMQLESGLYVKNPGNDVSGKNYDIIYYLDNYKEVYGKEFDGTNGNGGEPIGKNGLAVRAINQFLVFSSKNSSAERFSELLIYYDEYRLNTTLNGVHYFIEQGDTIVANPDVYENAGNLGGYYNSVFKPFIEKRCIPYLATNVTEYRKLSRVDYQYLLYLELPIAYCLSGFLTYFVPPLFFRRGRKTLGKALYHIGLIDKRILSPSFPRFLARFSIFFFGELIVSLFSFGIPYIISFSLMVFSKEKQGFPDYMLGLYEVDTSKANIYMDYVEAQLKNELHGDPIDFKMEKPL